MPLGLLSLEAVEYYDKMPPAYLVPFGFCLNLRALGIEKFNGFVVTIEALPISFDSQVE